MTNLLLESCVGCRGCSLALASCPSVWRYTCSYIYGHVRARNFPAVRLPENRTRLPASAPSRAAIRAYARVTHTFRAALAVHGRGYVCVYLYGGLACAALCVSCARARLYAAGGAEDAHARAKGRAKENSRASGRPTSRLSKWAKEKVAV